jgi:hypothetical protein
MVIVLPVGMILFGWVVMYIIGLYVQPDPLVTFIEEQKQLEKKGQ